METIYPMYIRYPVHQFISSSALHRKASSLVQQFNSSSGSRDKPSGCFSAYGRRSYLGYWAELFRRLRREHPLTNTAGDFSRSS